MSPRNDTSTITHLLKRGMFERDRLNCLSIYKRNCSWQQILSHSLICISIVAFPVHFDNSLNDNCYHVTCSWLMARKPNKIRTWISQWYLNPYKISDTQITRISLIDGITCLGLFIMGTYEAQIKSSSVFVTRYITSLFPCEYVGIFKTSTLEKCHVQIITFIHFLQIVEILQKV